MSEFTKEKESKERKSKTSTKMEPSKIIPDTREAIGKKAKPTSIVSKKPAASSLSETADSLLLAAHKAFAKDDGGLKEKKRDALYSSLLSTIADDEELAESYVASGSHVSSSLVSIAIGKLQIGVRDAASAIAKAQRVSICFVVDTTGSMSSYIQAVKSQIVSIVEEVKKTSCEIEGLAFVGYKDFSEGPNHFEIFNFSKHTNEFKEYVGKIVAGGGGDFPEDVNGGIWKALELSWPSKSASRIIFHIADAPPHGSNFHNKSDNFPSGHTSDHPWEDIFAEMENQNIMYYFGKVNEECTKMIEEFRKHSTTPIVVYDTSNPGSITHSVTASVMDSVSMKSGLISSKIRLNGLSRTFELSSDMPDWADIAAYPMLDATIVSLNLPTIDQISEFVKMEQKLDRKKVQIASSPFAKGSVRYAFHGLIHYPAYTTKDGKKIKANSDSVVFKELIKLAVLEDLDRQRYMMDLEVQTVAAALAFEFNNRLERTSAYPGIKLKYLMAKVVRITMPSGVQRFVASEKKFRESSATVEMTKFTNNFNFVRTAGDDVELKTQIQLAVAYSHFTYDITNEYCLVCDLQGMQTHDDSGNTVLLLTDPAIHCPKQLRFGKTNLQQSGVRAFFLKHECNIFCDALGLKPCAEYEKLKED
eukprot:gene5143-7163_t